MKFGKFSNDLEIVVNFCIRFVIKTLENPQASIFSMKYHKPNLGKSFRIANPK